MSADAVRSIAVDTSPVHAVIAKKGRDRVKVSLVFPGGYATIDSNGAYWGATLLPALRAGFARRGIVVTAATRRQARDARRAAS